MITINTRSVKIELIDELVREMKIASTGSFVYLRRSQSKKNIICFGRICVRL
jgi:hypothetical protein